MVSQTTNTNFNIMTYRNVWTIETIIIIFIILAIFILLYLIHENVGCISIEPIDIIILKADGCPMCKSILSFFEMVTKKHKQYYKISIMDVMDFVRSLDNDEKARLMGIKTPYVMLKVNNEYKKLNNLNLLFNYHNHLNNKNVDTIYS